MCSGASIPSPETLRMFLIVCGVAADALDGWTAARAQALATTGPARDAVRVRTADPRLLGVHASVQIEPGAEDLPVYVPRDVDADLRTAITAAQDRGGFVLVKGSSSVGKTRALFEAVRAVCPEWWLLHPVDAAAVRAFADTPAPRTVVWLDELQRYLTQPGGVPAGVVRALLAAKLVVVATLWPGEYTTRTALRTPAQDDPYAENRELLGLARIIEVPDTFSPAERQRAEDLAADQRIQVALNTTDAGVTQVLAAGPQMARWWEHADNADPRQCYGKAVITAALDARRVGAAAALTVDFLAAAAPSYLTTEQQANAPTEWLEVALAYATTRLHGATACLTPIAAGMGTVAGYITADYLYQYASSLRRVIALPDMAWQAVIDHHFDDAMALADSAERRGQPAYAEAFYRRHLSRQPGDVIAACGMADLLAKQSRLDEAIALLRTHFENDDTYVTDRLALLLIKQDRIDEATVVLNSCDHIAPSVDCLVERGRVDAAVVVLQPRAEADAVAAGRLAQLFIEQERFDEALVVLRADADRSPCGGSLELAMLLADLGRVDELRRRADAGDRLAAARLASLLVTRDGADELRRRADAGDSSAATRLAGFLDDEGRVDEAIVVLQNVDRDRVSLDVHLASLLVKQGRVDEAVITLRRRVEAGDHSAVLPLGKLLVGVGQVSELVMMLQQAVEAGNWFNVRSLVDLLVEHREISDVVAMVRQYSGGLLTPFDRQDAAGIIADLLVKLGQVDEAIKLLKPYVDASYLINDQWVDLLAIQGRVDELRQQADAGNRAAADRLICLLAERGDSALAQEVNAGTRGAAARLLRS
jgi:tetratricopeptide (TPR) repeat protein